MAQRTAQQLSVEELRAQLSQRLRSNAAFSKTVYQDQPIIMTGTQLKSFVPDAIREARQLARARYAQNASVTDVFYEQARMLAGYEDDFEFTGSFSQYYPTYEDMSNEQLRGYFAWRTKLRAGQLEQGPLSFAYVYLYELINLVGITSAREGYDALLAFGTAYRRFDARFGQLFDAWLDDFVIYYGLDASLLRTRSFARNDAAFDVLLHHETHTSSELFDALVTLSSYPIADSPFFLEHEAELKQLVAHAYRNASQHHAKLKTTLPAKLAGRMKSGRLWLFQRAVFANPLAIEHAEYEISAHDTVYCRNGAWFRMRYENLEYPLLWVTQLLETCECVLRDAYAYPNTLERKLTTKYLLKSIEAQASELAEEARLREQRAVRIDFSQLDHIRKAADETCEKLIVDDDLQPTPLKHDAMLKREEPSYLPDEKISPFTGRTGVQIPDDVDASGDGCAKRVAHDHTQLSSAWGRMHKASCARAESANSAFERAQHCPSDCAVPMRSPEDQLSPDTSPLTSDEAAFLEALFAGSSLREFERTRHCMASVLVDSINEKLYDEFADICIDASSGEPTIVEDYAPELRALLGLS